MDIFEELVMQALAKEPYVFLNPQYSIKDENAHEWSCPDLVALNFRDRTVSVVEVTARASSSDLARKVEKRKEQWFDKLNVQLAHNKVVDGTWMYRVEIFARKEVCDKLKLRFVGQSDVAFNSLEDLGFPWNWQWGGKTAAHA
jgi:Holliday junction resolvase-like predicted endonuclease